MIGDSRYPPVSFHYVVTLERFPSAEHDFRFQSVSGLSATLGTEDLSEGGQNTYKYKMPSKTSYNNLILKRGILLNSRVIKWCEDALLNYEFQTSNLTVSLLNNKHLPLINWYVVDAYPVKWEVSELNAERNEIAIETIELAYKYFKTLRL